MGGKSEIGSTLIESFKKTLNEQVQKALARRIHAKVRDARGDPDRAARRWPFELIQNAHDAGPREGRDGITMSFELADSVLRFRHDAAPFRMADVAALLTGGSSKDFDSPETTGRFGTGFLVTHVLSERVKVDGVLDVDGEYREFEVTLFRPDDEELVLQNIEDSVSALGSPHDVSNWDRMPTAIIEYAVDDTETALKGLQALESALPYLFGSCRRLQEIKIRIEDQESRWRVVGSTKLRSCNGIWTDEITVNSFDKKNRDNWRVVRAMATKTACGRLLAALRRIGDNWSVWNVEGIASIFRQLPLLGAPKIQGWVIVDGDFDVDEERSSIHVVGERGRPLKEAFSALGGLALMATQEEWLNAYRIAQVALPAEGIGEAAAKVWQEVLSSAVANLARLPLVETVHVGKLPCVKTDGHERWADFISCEQPGPSHAALWKLAAVCTEADPPMENDSEGWSEVVAGWEDLGVSVHWLELGAIGERASSDATEIANLAIDGEPFRWLARYLDAVGEAWQASGITKSHVHKLLPDQRGTLRSSDELQQDNGVSERVKDIASDIGLDIRAKLLNNQLVQTLKQNSLENGLFVISEAAADGLTEEDSVRAIAQHISDAVPDEKRVTGDNENAVTASIKLLDYLWQTRGEDAKDVAWKIPLLASDGAAYMPGHRRLMVPPVTSWPEAARPFAKAYPAGRVLADRYADAPTNNALLEALASWGIAHRGLLTLSQREELGDRGLRAIASEPEEVENAVLREADLMQIALLEPEIINYCKQSRERARALLGLVLCYVAQEDKSWQSMVEMSVRTPDGEKKVRLTPSLWLSDLRSKPWILVEGEQDVTQHIPNPELLRELVDPSWLEGNSDGAHLLVRHFEMDALDVRLLAATTDEGARQQLRDSLARIVEVAGDNPALISDFLEKAEQRKQNINRMRNLGLAVQECVKRALEDRQLQVRDVDRGYDFRVTSVNVREDDTEDLSAYFEIGSYKVEVKTTTTGEIHLTPLQAATSVTDSESFVLCVVDLRDYEGDVHQVDWDSTDVSAHCRFVSGEALPVNETLGLVRNAEERKIPIRNATALRYAVRPEFWVSGLGLNEWVGNAFMA